MKMCCWLGVSRQDYYKWRCRKPSQRAELIMDAFKMATVVRNAKPGLIVHSDRGVQYRSCEYYDLLHDQGAQPSMSRKGNCWDNAAMESFFARLKVECSYAEDIKSKDDAYRTVFEYIELFYNRIRRHSTNGYQSTKYYEKQYSAAIA